MIRNNQHIIDLLSNKKMIQSNSIKSCGILLAKFTIESDFFYFFKFNQSVLKVHNRLIFSNNMALVCVLI
jgi:hypothetical protein